MIGGWEIRKSSVDGVWYTGPTADVYKNGKLLRSFGYTGRLGAWLYIATHFWKRS